MYGIWLWILRAHTRRRVRSCVHACVGLKITWSLNHSEFTGQRGPAEKYKRESARTYENNAGTRWIRENLLITISNAQNTIYRSIYHIVRKSWRNVVNLFICNRDVPVDKFPKREIYVIINNNSSAVDHPGVKRVA